MIRIEGHYRLDKVLRGHYDALRDHYEVPAHGNVDSSTKLVLRFNEIPAGSRKRRFQY